MLYCLTIQSLRSRGALGTVVHTFALPILMFIGFAHAYRRHHGRLLIRDVLMLGFFLAGLVVLSGLQKWWLQDLLGGLEPTVLFWGATALTAITDNAALTYLGSLVEGDRKSTRLNSSH